MFFQVGKGRGVLVERDRFPVELIEVDRDQLFVARVVQPVSADIVVDFPEFLDDGVIGADVSIGIES